MLLLLTENMDGVAVTTETDGEINDFGAVARNPLSRLPSLDDEENK